MTRTVSYQAVECTYTDPLLGNYRSYAIVCRDPDGAQLALLDDFSADRAEAEAFAAQITAADLDPIHLTDAACDFLYLQYAVQ